MITLKPWANGVASRCKLKTWVYLWLRLARHLQWLALTLVKIKFACKSKQVFHHLATHPKSTQVEWCPIKYFFVTCMYLWGNLRVHLATQRKSLHKFNLSTCKYQSVWLGLKLFQILKGYQLTIYVCMVRDITLASRLQHPQILLPTSE